MERFTLFVALCVMVCLQVVLSLWSEKLSPPPCKTFVSSNRIKLDCSNTNLTRTTPSKQVLDLAGIVNEVDLSNNKIRNCAAYAFEQYDNLVHLDLHNNWLEFIHVNCFKNLTILKSLDLRFNQFNYKYINKNVFQDLHSLEEIYVSMKCPHSTLPRRLFEPLVNLRVFSMTGALLYHFLKSLNNFNSFTKSTWHTTNALNMHLCYPNNCL